MAKKRRYKRKNKKNGKVDLKIIGTMVFSVVLAVLIYKNSGALGEKLNEILGGMIGILRYFLPIGTFWIAIIMATKDKENEYLTNKLTQYVFLIICISIVMSIYQISNGALEIGGNISQVLKKAFTLGVSNIGGGAIGTLAAVPLIKLLGNLGAIVSSIGVSIILFAFVFGIDLSEFIKQKVENILEKYNENKEERKLKKEEKINAIKIRKNEMKEKRRQERQQQIAENLARENAIKQPIMENQIRINQDVASDNDNKEEKKHIGFLIKKGKAFEKENDLSIDTKQLGLMSEDGKNDALFKQEDEQKEDKTKQVLQLEHTMVVEEEDDNYIYPSVNLLLKASKKVNKAGQKILQDTAAKLQRTLYSFGVKAKVENVTVGPAITRYELKPAEGERVSKIAKLSDDIALNLAAESIRIEAPIPGKQAVGIEIPNQEKEMVPLRDVIESLEFQNNKSKLSVALGKDVAGGIVIADIAKMPHVLIAGSTGSGKSVCINTIITSIIYNAKPSEVKMVMIDPKVVELSIYNGIPHLLIPVVTDPKKAAGALAWAAQEMDDRYNKFAEKGVRDLKGYNHAIEEEGGFGKMPQIVVIIDELADLMMVASKEVEASICRLAQKARAAGMHLVIATQRPSVDVITGLIKANVPSRIAFAVASRTDSGTILDQIGAEKLLGKGDMLYFPAGSSKPARVQGCFVSDEEVENIVSFIKSNGTAKYNEDILESIENSGKSDQDKANGLDQSEEDDVDPFLNEAIETVVETKQASTSFIQRRFKVGYARAGRIIDQLEERGVIGKYQGSKPREVLWTIEKLKELGKGISETNHS